MVDFKDLFARTPIDPAGHRAGAGLALSGGGFRAMLFHVGSLRRLYEIGALQRVERISSVSGGSIAAAQLALAWDELVATDDVRLFEERVQIPLFDFAGKRIDGTAGIRGLLTPRRSIAESVANAYDRHLFQGRQLDDLPDDPRFVFCATNLGSGSLVRFAKKYTADYRIGKRDGLVLPLATVVAASAAFPPVLSPLIVELDDDQALTEQFPLRPGEERPELHDVNPYTRRLELSDGGVYDNLGLQPIDQYHTLLVSDGGGPFEYDPSVPVNWLNHMIRAWKVTDNQVRSLRRSETVGQLVANSVRHGAFWSIQTRYSDYERRSIDVDDRWAGVLKKVPTRLWHIDVRRRKQLVNWGYAITDAAVRSFLSDDLVASRLPYPDEPLADPPPPPAEKRWWQLWKSGDAA